MGSFRREPRRPTPTSERDQATLPASVVPPPNSFDRITTSTDNFQFSEENRRTSNPNLTVSPESHRNIIVVLTKLKPGHRRIFSGHRLDGRKIMSRGPLLIAHRLIARSVSLMIAQSWSDVPPTAKNAGIKLSKVDSWLTDSNSATRVRETPSRLATSA